MYLIYHSNTRIARDIASKIHKQFENLKIPFLQSDEINNDSDIIISIGDDHHFLNTFQSANDKPVFCIGIGGTVLSDVNPHNYTKYLDYIIDGKYFIQKKSRIKIGSNEALNDILIFPPKSGSILQFTVRINGSEIYTDSSDGVILSTPTGSTAYNLSAGGSAIIGDPPVFSLVSANSIKKQKPLIVDDKSIISIRIHDHAVAIIDGLQRIPLESEAVIQKSEPIQLIRCKHDFDVYTQINKVEDSILRIKTHGLSPAQKFIFKMLSKGPMTQKELIYITTLPARTVREALITLENKQIIDKTPYAQDIRQSVYKIV
ncbi:hypothetical protein K9M79_08530 [Candidatus Woesearchaeota archaeon]|nr:hypothetical protein [Candidatus Woesearchaeota archaeon]